MLSTRCQQTDYRRRRSIGLLTTFSIVRTSLSREGLFNLIRAVPHNLRYEPGLILAADHHVIVPAACEHRVTKNWIAADIVRIADGVLVEHWDVLSGRSDKSEVAKWIAGVRRELPRNDGSSSGWRLLGAQPDIMGPRADSRKAAACRGLGVLTFPVFHSLGDALRGLCSDESESLLALSFIHMPASIEACDVPNVGKT